jgi:hypothetical protein
MNQKALGVILVPSLRIVAKMTDSSELYTGMEVGDDLSSAMRTETLTDREYPGIR